MKLELTRDWFMAAADREGDQEIGAGIAARDPVVAAALRHAPEDSARSEATHIAFGRLMHMMRRQRAMTVEALAARARIDAEEVLLIEAKPDFRADVRTVHQLAEVFQLQPKALLELAGATTVREEIVQEALKFAASSEPIAKLTHEEAAAVDAFVAALNRLADQDKKAV
jgi:transcriptional regulator with XRE-family HTH domain